MIYYICEVMNVSKWDKLLSRICALDKGMRFDELRKVLESYGYEMKHPAVVIVRSEKSDAIRSPFPCMSQSKQFMFGWSKRS